MQDENLGNQHSEDQRPFGEVKNQIFSGKPEKSINKEKPDEHIFPIVVHVYSEHPLGEMTIRQAVISDPGLSLAGEVLPEYQLPQEKDVHRVLVLDIVSVAHWEDVLIRWRRPIDRVVALISTQRKSNAEQLKAIYLGVAGMVEMSSDLTQELSSAIHAVAAGKLWIHHDILAEYARGATPLLQQLSMSHRCFTCREGQVLRLLFLGHTNKEIGAALAISERTVKFHVSNILQKLQIDNRKELMRRNTADGFTYRDLVSWKNAKGEIGSPDQQSSLRQNS